MGVPARTRIRRPRSLHRALPQSHRRRSPRRVAHNDLGVLYLNANRPQDALAEFDRAAGLQPNLAPCTSTPVSRRSRSIVPATRKPPRGEPSISIATTIARISCSGGALVAQFQYNAAALASLRIAVQEFPEAHLAMADVLMHQGSNHCRAQRSGSLPGRAPSGAKAARGSVAEDADSGVVPPESR